MWDIFGHRKADKSIVFTDLLTQRDVKTSAGDNELNGQDHAVPLEENPATEYSTTTGERQKTARWVIRRDISLWPWVAALVLLLILVGGWVAYLQLRPRSATESNVQPSAPTAPELPTQQAPASITPPATPAPPPTQKAPENITRAAPPETAAPPKTANAPGISLPAATSVPPSTVPVAPAVLELKIKAAKITRVTVVADGSRVFDGELTTGENPQFEANDRFEVTVQDSSAVILELNGQTLRPLRPPHQPATATLTHQDLRKPPAPRRPRNRHH